MRFELSKAFHVSPFMPMDVGYRWSFTEPSRGLTVHMENYDDRGKIFDATLVLEREAMTPRSLNTKLVTYPLASMAVVSRIYWNALLLWLKGCPPYTHPKTGAPLENV